MYRQSGLKSGEADFVLCIMKGNAKYKFVIESKYREKPSNIVPERGKIVLTKNVLEVRGGIIYVPAALLLLLF